MLARKSAPEIDHDLEDLDELCRWASVQPVNTVEFPGFEPVLKLPKAKVADGPRLSRDAGIGTAQTFFDFMPAEPSFEFV